MYTVSMDPCQDVIRYGINFVREIISNAHLCEFNACSIDSDSIPLPRIMVMYFPLPYYVKC